MMVPLFLSIPARYVVRKVNFGKYGKKFIITIRATDRKHIYGQIILCSKVYGFIF